MSFSVVPQDSGPAQSPVRGTIAAFDGQNWQGLPPGASTQVLTLDPTQKTGVKWAPPGGSLPTTGLELDQYFSTPAVASWTGTVTLNLANNNLFVGTLSGNTTLAFTGGNNGQPVFIYAQQAASGGPYSITFPGSVAAWFGSPYTAPAMPSTASAYLAAMLREISTGVYMGHWAGNSA